MNLPGTSLEGQIKTSPGRHFRTSPGRQIGTSPGWSNRTFRGRPGDVRGGRPRDVLRTNICRLGLFDSVYRKDGNDYSKVFFEKFIHNCFWKSIKNLGFGGFGSSPGNIRIFFKHKQYFEMYFLKHIFLFITGFITF